MTEILPYVLIGSIIILTAVLTAVGIQLFLVLKTFRQTVERLNSVAHQAELRVASLGQPLQNLAGIAAGVKTGIKVFEGFVGFLNRKKDSKEE